MPSSLCFFFVVHLALGCPGARWKGSPSLGREISKACEAYRRSCREGLDLASLGAHLGALGEVGEDVTSCYMSYEMLSFLTRCYKLLAYLALVHLHIFRMKMLLFRAQIIVKGFWRLGA